jgi:hypothetical protein
MPAGGAGEATTGSCVALFPVSAVPDSRWVPLPRKKTKRAKLCVAWKIKQATKHGAKRIDPEARRFAR